MDLIFADDLTGACDVAAALGRPVPVVIHSPPPGNMTHHYAEVVVCDLETRNLNPEQARLRVREAFLAMRKEGLAVTGRPIYWKMDSLLRGNWEHELVEAIALANIERIVVAPAFPEQERITRNGVQYAHSVPVSQYTGQGSSEIAPRLRAAGISPDRFRVVDAETELDLLRVARELRAGELPVGSAGFARKLWGPRAAIPSPVVGPVLVVVGTASPRARVQMDALSGEPDIVLIAPDTGPALLRCVDAALARWQPASLVIVGGETLAGVIGLIDARSLLVLGEISPGMALATISGGALHGAQIVTKAGDFGHPDALLSAIRLLRP